ncbi:ABC-type nitrate/sulfonate/bicarbonate transport system, permease component [Rhodococcus sp. AW25M09]|uniref:ABC transporter permease n=1 Tax=Rhodococcus sp. AW25M09 TaxID=1268303 RepID=UPI0002ACA3A9|nr:ABC transporter permease subunit [Rhodococcus sp. AW25M09]CCQ15774.1 ABC-type nitrate/sulfonate/bicarbonate transport system, permease component [Rhodococcus sp. AW25M09]
MTTVLDRPEVVAPAPIRPARLRRPLMAVAAVASLLVLWELVKVLVPENGVSVAGVRVLPRTDDGALPHVWSVLAALAEPEVNVAGARSVGAAIVSSGLFTFGLAVLGFALGAVVGLVLAVAMQRFVWVERSVLPYVIVSQTVPLIALAPLVAGWGGKIAIGGYAWQPWMSITVIASYLAFFPMAVGMLRGLRSPDRAALDLMHSYACGWWTTLVRLRLPASVPHLIPALRLAAAASVIGAVVAEISTGTTGGIGRTIIVFSQQATGDASRLYAAVLGAAVLGLVVTGLVSLLEIALGRYVGRTPARRTEV